ncbi:MAG: 16S rRNA (adenine(1518)-N(6)/adenine(1519)-N(6))-dimethyltransferase RsmA [Fusobacteriaceae bacterium]|jgi:16S rRNA (adenine1518-N6/adenine1519-N6)-dimethyltransferase|nr:16S rRNA (adenine(1518)-N(6)/adenine(1519)-N(6))-dimethyltransferase RsmA [Fusobacteriaceae bacterium]
MNYRPKKKYGQNFLNGQKDILSKIIEVSSISKNTDVLEIGPGQGALTKLLLDNANSLTAIEIDADLAGVLRENFKNYDNFNLLIADFLELDLKTLPQDKKLKVVANIPYYITSPIINKLIENRDMIDSIYIMVQKEVGERICAKKGKTRGILTLAIEYYGEAHYLFTIPKEAFTPIPKVDSVFITIKFYDNEKKKYTDIISEELFFKYIKAAFSNKRKTIVNNFLTLDIDKNKICDVLKKVGISEMERGENIPIGKYIDLIKEFENL